MQETQVRYLGWGGPQEKEMATHPSILAWEIPWTEEPGGLQSVKLQSVRYDLATKQQICPVSFQPDRYPPTHTQSFELTDTLGSLS